MWDFVLALGVVASTTGFAAESPMSSPLPIERMRATVPIVRADDLLSTYKLAQEHDPRYRAAEAIYRATGERVPQARASLLPSLSAKADKTRNSEEVVTDSDIVSRPTGETRYHSTGYVLSLSQPVYSAAGWAGLRQAHAEVRRAEAEYAAANQDLMLRLAEAYFSVLAAQDGLDLVKAEKTAIAHQHEVAQERLKVGLAAITETHDARARLEVAQAQEIEAENRLEDKREALREITGESPGKLLKLSNFSPSVPDPPDVQRWVKVALEQNLALQARREAADAAREEVKRQQAGHLPTLDIVGTRSRNDADASIPGPGVRSTNMTLGLQLQIPILQGGLISSRVNEASYRYQAVQQEYEAQYRATERAARTSFSGVAGGIGKMAALKEAVAAGEGALEGKTEGFRVGITTNLDVLDAQRELYRTKRDHAESRFAYVLNLFRLKQAAGTLSEADLTQANGWFSPP